MNKRIAAIMGCLLASIAFSSCNTFVGLGRDVRRLGEGVENRAYGKTWNGQPMQQTSPVPQTDIPR